MSKSEKRNFKLFVQRSFSQKKDLNFMLVYEVLNSMTMYDPKRILDRLPQFSAKQISDLKGHLYTQILQCLRFLNSNKSLFNIRQGLDFATVLYQKGMFIQSLEQLQKTKQIAESQENFSLLHEILEFEKKIESRHVTRSHANRAKEITESIHITRQKLFLMTRWSDLSIQLYSRYLKIGHVKNKKEHFSFQKYFEDNKPRNRGLENSSFFIKLHKIRSHLWYFFIQQDFKNGYRYGRKYVQLFDDFPSFLSLEKVEFIRAQQNCMNSAFYCIDEKRHLKHLNELHRYFQEEDLSINAQLMAFAYIKTGELNDILLSGNFMNCASRLERIIGEIDAKERDLDRHRMMLIWYKIATIYFTRGENKKCISYLNKIINRNELSLREDVQSFARILDLVAHFELGNEELVFYRIKSVYRFLGKLKDLQAVQLEFMKFLKKTVYMDQKNMKPAFILLRDNLIELRKNPYENRPFLYLDIISWLDSKIEDRPVAEMVNLNLEKIKNPPIK
ncbi:MAG: hypothetical protein AAF487_05550 [Bacteroidota bacterium]